MEGEVFVSDSSTAYLNEVVSMDASKPYSTVEYMIISQYQMCTLSHACMNSVCGHIPPEGHEYWSALSAKQRTRENMARYLVTFVILSIVISLSVAVSVTPPVKPNIVFVLVDDWGFAEVGFRNPKVKTPNFDELAKTGLILNRHYVYMYCSPSRASLLTGRWPHHVHQWNPPRPATVGANINMTMLPAKLKKGGYNTHMVGKWHEGYFDPAYLPVSRGFDTSSGFLNGAEDHIKESQLCAVDYWKNMAPDPRNGTYDSYIYRDDLTEVIMNHDTSKPFFLYLPLHNVHSPFQAPKEWIDLYPKGSTCDFRRTFQAMVSVADNVTGHVVQLLKERKMWDNTLMIVSADNGGAPCAGSNYPLKGSKATMFEGGVRALAFANGGVLPDSMRGKTGEGFVHIADWYPTFCKMAGVDPSDSGPGKLPVDGLDVWPIISGENTTTQHGEIVLGYNFSHIHNVPTGAIIVGEYKLIVGRQSQGCDSTMFTPLEYPCTNGTYGNDCDPYCLYNIIEDPGERQDLSKTKPDILKMMVDRYNSHAKEPQDMLDQGYHSASDLPTFDDACKYMAEHGGYWRPWVNV